MPKGIFDGVRIVDTGQWLAGTGAGAILGYLGAETIKIEDPVRGDSYRGMASQYGERTSVKGRHIGFETANLNKKSMTLDLKKEKGKQVLFELVKKCDIFHTNATDSVRKKLGLDYQILKAHNPKVIYGVTTIYGSRGRLNDRRGFDTIAQAYSGIMWSTGDQDYDEPMGITGALIDWSAACTMAFAMSSALLARDRLGIGQEIHVSLLGSSLYLQTFNTNMTLLRGRPWARYKRRTSANPLSNNYRCSDGKWIMLAEPQSQRFWAEACDLFGISPLAADPRFATSEARTKNCAELVKILDGVFAKKSRDEWIDLLEKSGTRMAYSAVFDLSETLNQQQTIDNGYVEDFNHPVMGPVKLSGFPVWFSETPGRIHSEAPEHGQHTEEVLIDILGYSWEQVGELRAEGVI
ncbi:MAG: CoA transferase [Chloroflexota bacterium]